jgi:hypothetical protein
VERVRVVKCSGGNRCSKVGVFATGNRGSRGGASEGGDVDEGVQGGQKGGWASSGLEVKGVTARRRSYSPKDVFGWVLEFGGRRATGREKIIKGGDAWRENVVDVGGDTSDCGGPWDTYSGRGRTSIGVVIRIGGVKRIKRIGHLTLRSARIRLS